MDCISSKELKKYRYFSGLSDGALEAMAKKMHPVDLPRGTIIINEGAPAGAFYMICKGEVEVTKKTKWDQTAKLSIVGPGESFGEMALLTNLPRSSTVAAKTDVSLFKLNREDFEEIIHLDTAFSNVMETQAKKYAEFDTLKTLQPLALIEPEKRLALIDKMQEKTYAPGESIINQGNRGSEYFIIKSGRVAVIKKKDKDGQEQVDEMGSGEGFGEEAIIRGKPRNATVCAIDETTVLVLEKASFEGVLRKSFVENAFPEDIDADERDKYVFIDARIPPEYDEEHIAGAVNIPIEVLRDKFRELDKSKTYYTYCTNDSRGMTAAFLMKSMGYDVHALRGGISAWEGPTSRGNDGIHTPSAQLRI